MVSLDSLPARSFTRYKEALVPRRPLVPQATPNSTYSPARPPSPKAYELSIFCLVDGYHLMTEDGMVGSLNMTLKGLVAVVFIGVRAREHL